MPTDKSPAQVADEAIREAHTQCANCHGAIVPYPDGDHLGNPWDCARLHAAISRAVLAARLEQAERSTNSAQYAIDIGSTLSATHQRLVAEHDRLRRELDAMDEAHAT